MNDGYLAHEDSPGIGLWEKLKGCGGPISFDLEVTARCNNDCRHCYINLPAGDRAAEARELSLPEIERIAAEAASMGALSCLITGGEPLLRRDFPEVFMALKRQGLLVSVFTNACLVTPAHVELFRNYPPRDIEVSVYGATREVYEAVTRRPGTYEAFRRGLDLLLESGAKVLLKAMALRANVHELPAIAAFCRERTNERYRFDPFLHLRFDGDPVRNAEIREERLSPAEIVAVERADEERFGTLQMGCAELIRPDHAGAVDDILFRCDAGTGSFNVGYEGTLRLCRSLWHPETIYDLRTGTLAEAWETVAPRVRALRSQSPRFLEKCARCGIINLCPWCPAAAVLESGQMDAWVEDFCEVAHERSKAISEAAASVVKGS